MSEIASYSRIFKIAVPIMLSNAMVSMIGLVDAGVIGRLGEVSPLAAVGLGGAVISSFFWMFMFLAVTTTSDIGRAVAKGEDHKVTESLSRAIWLSGVISIALVFVIPLLVWLLPYILGTSAEVTPLFRQYFMIRICAAPIAMLTHVATGYFIAYERTRTVLVYKSVSQVINLLLNVLFVMGLGWGVAGVAIASFVAEIVALILIAYFMRDELSKLWVYMKDKTRIHLPIGAYLQNSSYVFIRALCLQLTFLIFAYLGNHLGDEALAINSVLLIFVFMVAQASDGFATASEVLATRSIGLGSIRALRINSLKCTLVSLMIALSFATIFIIFDQELFGLVSTNDSLRDMAPVYMKWVALGAVIGVLAWSLDGIFFGSNLGREMAIAMMVSFVAFLLAAWIFVPIFGNHGLWGALVINFLIRGVGLSLFYPRVERLINPDLISSINPKP